MPLFLLGRPRDQQILSYFAQKNALRKISFDSFMLIAHTTSFFTIYDVFIIHTCVMLRARQALIASIALVYKLWAKNVEVKKLKVRWECQAIVHRQILPYSQISKGFSEIISTL